MDFHSLGRRELQALCKKNSIRANITNAAMADALDALDHVKGLEEFMKSIDSEPLKSPERPVTESPCVPRTTRRTSTRRETKPIKGELESSKSFTQTRRGSRRGVAEEIVEEKKIKVLETPVVPTNKKRAPSESTCRKSLEMETSVQKGCSTRRSTRLTEKKLANLSLKDKENNGSINIDFSKDVHEDLDNFSSDGASKDTTNEVCLKRNNDSEVVSVPKADDLEENVEDLKREDQNNCNYDETDSQVVSASDANKDTTTEVCLKKNNDSEVVSVPKSDDLEENVEDLKLEDQKNTCNYDETDSQVVSAFDGSSTKLTDSIHSEEKGIFIQLKSECHSKEMDTNDEQKGLPEDYIDFKGQKGADGREEILEDCEIKSIKCERGSDESLSPQPDEQFAIDLEDKGYPHSGNAEIAPGSGNTSVEGEKRTTNECPSSGNLLLSHEEHSHSENVNNSGDTEKCVSETNAMVAASDFLQSGEMLMKTELESDQSVTIQSVDMVLEASMTTTDECCDTEKCIFETTAMAAASDFLESGEMLMKTELGSDQPVAPQSVDMVLEPSMATADESCDTEKCISETTAMAAISDFLESGEMQMQTELESDQSAAPQSVDMVLEPSMTTTDECCDAEKCISKTTAMAAASDFLESGEMLMKTKLEFDQPIAPQSVDMVLEASMTTTDESCDPENGISETTAMAAASDFLEYDEMLMKTELESDQSAAPQSVDMVLEPSMTTTDECCDNTEKCISETTAMAAASDFVESGEMQMKTELESDQPVTPQSVDMALESSMTTTDECLASGNLIFTEDEVKSFVASDLHPQMAAHPVAEIAQPLLIQMPGPAQSTPGKSSKERTNKKVTRVLDINKENIYCNGENSVLRKIISKEEAAEKEMQKSLNEKSLTQLKKLLREKMQITNKHNGQNNNEEKSALKVGKTRPALTENRMPAQN